MKPLSQHILLLLLICSALLLDACQKNPVKGNSGAQKQTDSLISVNQIRNNVICVSFGADAITAVKTQTGIVLVDAGISAGLTELYRKRIEKQYPGAPFTCVINTHAHHDHYRGNSVFNEARIVAHQNSLKEIRKESQNPLKTAQELKKIADEYDQKYILSAPHTEAWKENFTQKMRYTSACRDVLNREPLKLPGIVFSDSLTLNAGDVTFQMIYFGKCHSNSDILVFCPELNVLFTGDLFSKYGRISYNSDEPDKARWIKALAWLNKRKPQIKTVIGGHGQIMQMEDLEAFEKNIIRQAGGSSE